MAAPLLLVLALIQAPNAAPQDVPLATLTVEPVLARGIEVQVVEDVGVEAARTEPVELTAAPITRATFVGVVPKRGLDCVAQNRPCPPQYITGRVWMWNPLGWDWESRTAMHAILLQQREFLESNVGYQRGHAMAEAAAAAPQAGSAQSSSARGGASSGRSSNSSGSNAGGGRSSGSTWTGTSSGASTTGSPLSRGRME